MDRPAFTVEEASAFRDIAHKLILYLNKEGDDQCDHRRGVSKLEPSGADAPDQAMELLTCCKRSDGQRAMSAIGYCANSGNSLRKGNFCTRYSQTAFNVDQLSII